MPADPEINRLIRALARDPVPAKSLFLPLVPLRKFPPADSDPLPEQVMLSIATDAAFQTFFPFHFDRPAEPLSSSSDFHEIALKMYQDREFVVNTSITVAVDTDPRTDVSLRLEYSFSSSLLRRIVNGPYWHVSSQPIFYHMLLDLVAQFVKFQDQIRISRDNVGNLWLRLRGQPPYRENSFYTDVTAICFQFGKLVRVVFGEGDDDIDTWYQYEWFSPVVKDFLSSEPLSVSTEFGQQASVLQKVLKKLTKLLAK